MQQGMRHCGLEVPGRMPVEEGRQQRLEVCRRRRVGQDQGHEALRAVIVEAVTCRGIGGCELPDEL